MSHIWSYSNVNGQRYLILDLVSYILYRIIFQYEILGKGPVKKHPVSDHMPMWMVRDLLYWITSQLLLTGNLSARRQIGINITVTIFLLIIILLVTITIFLLLVIIIIVFLIITIINFLFLFTIFSIIVIQSC